MLRTCSLCLSLLLPSALPGLAQTPPQTFRNVEVRGAELVPKDDIRLTCGDLAGIALDEAQLRSVEDCLMSTGVFESVVVAGRGEALVIEVVELESRPGRVDAGIAWVNDHGLTGTLAYEQINLIPGAYTSVRFGYAEEYRSYAANLYRRESFGPALHLGLDIAGERTGFDDRSFSTRSDQVEAYLAWTPREGLRAELGLGYRDHALFAVEPGASALLIRESGQATGPFLHAVLAYRSRGAEGAGDLTLRLDQYLWNLGTGQGVAETRLEAGLRQPLGARTDLVLGLRGGIVAGQGGHYTTALDRSFLGGETFRGFAPRGLGPSDAGDRLGGNRSLIGSVELQRDLGAVRDQALRGGVFVDLGSVWSLDDTLGGAIGDAAHLRSSIGLSLTFDLAEVPVALYLATPLGHEPGDRRQVFGLSATARF